MRLRAAVELRDDFGALQQPDVQRHARGQTVVPLPYSACALKAIDVLS